MKAYQTLFAVLLLVLTGMAGFAAAEEPISIVSKAEIEETVVNEQGEKETVRVPAAKVMPGTVVIFTNTCTNISDSHIDDVVINNPIERQLFGRLLCQCGDCARLPLDTCACGWADDKRVEVRELLAG